MKLIIVSLTQICFFREIKTGEGIYGLRRAFQEAGAKSVLSTLWEISDAGAQVFMRRFHQRLLAGESAQQALAVTQRAFLQLNNTAIRFIGRRLPWLGVETGQKPQNR